MPAIINASYFKNDLYIPQAVELPTMSSSPAPTAINGLEDCITYTERDILLHCLGLTLYNSLQTALPITGGTDQKWEDLVNGCEYDGKIWEGLSNAKSLLAYAVYYAYLDYNSSFWTTLGIEKPKAENSQAVMPHHKMATAFQEFTRKYQKGYCFEPYMYRYDGAVVIDYFGEREEVEVSLFQFLRDKKEVYGWEEKYFRPYRQQNSFGL